MKDQEIEQILRMISATNRVISDVNEKASKKYNDCLDLIDILHTQLKVTRIMIYILTFLLLVTLLWK